MPCKQYFLKNAGITISWLVNADVTEKKYALDSEELVVFIVIKSWHSLRRYNSYKFV